MTNGRGIGAVVAALLLPPLGVFLVRGFGAAFAIAVALTLLAFIPGVVYALYAVLTAERPKLRAVPA